MRTVTHILYSQQTKIIFLDRQKQHKDVLILCLLCVVYFDQCLSAAHSKYWTKIFFSMVFYKKAEKGINGLIKWLFTLDDHITTVCYDGSTQIKVSDSHTQHPNAGQNIQKPRLKSGTFSNRAHILHLNTGNVRYSDRDCICIDVYGICLIWLC